MGERTPLRLLLYFDQGYSVFGCGHCHVMHGNCRFSLDYTAGASSAGCIQTTAVAKPDYLVSCEASIAVG